MKRTEKLSELRSLQARVDAIRHGLGISPPHRVLLLASRDVVADEVVVVEADGFGGATTSVVEGNYPLDYVTKYEKSFPSEKDAEGAAEGLSLRGTHPGQVLGAAA